MEAHTNDEELALAAPRLLQAQTLIWNHIFSFINSMSLKSAIDLNIIDTIYNHGKPMPLSTLISTLQIHPFKTRHIYRLMRILTHSGFFSLQNIPEIDDDDQSQKLGYVLTDASNLLLKDHPLSMRPFLVFQIDPILIKPWFELSSWFQNDDLTSFVTTHEKTFWEYSGQDPKLNQIFNEAMASDSRLVSSLVVNECKKVFQGLGSLVDVAGGTGTMTKAIAKMFPKIECIVFDLPHVIDGLHGSGILKFVSGDMFEAIPPTDAVLLKSILHDWNDEECVKILKKCKEAITINKGKEGKVIIIDIMMMENDKGDNVDDEFVETQHFWDMLMMVLLTGKERTRKNGLVCSSLLASVITR